MRRRAAVLQKVVHFLTALTILLKAVSKLDHPEGYWTLIIVFIAAAVYIVAITLLHDRLHHHVRLLTASVYLIECGVTATAAWLSAAEGKKGLPWGFGLAAVLFLVALVVHLVRTVGNGHPAERVNGA
jgi:hypothetical protein